MKEMGLFGITVPEEYGGLDLDPVSFALVFEEIARGWMGIAGILGSHSLACRLIAMHGTEEQKQKLPARARHRRAAHRHRPHRARRRHRPAGHPDHRPARRRPTTSSTARRCGSPTPATPTRCRCWSRPTRRASPAHQGMSVLLIEADTPGYEVTKDIPKLGYKGTESCEISLDDVRVPVAQLRRRRRGPRHAAGALRARVGPGQHRRPLGRASPSAPTTRRWPTPSSARRSASRSRTSRRSSSSSASSAPRSRPPG